MQLDTRRSLTSSVFVVACAATVAAQTRVREIADGAAGDSFGWSVAAVGDVDADGVDDFAIGSPFADVNGADSGEVRVYSGRTLAVLRSWAGLGAKDGFGYSVAGVGDVDGDGFDDVIVGAPGSSDLYDFGYWPIVHGAGYAQIFSGQSGVVLHHLSGSTSSAALGASVAGGFDVDGDSISDVLIGAPGSFSTSGYVLVVSGATGATIRTHTGGESLGYGTCLLGDLDGDGRSEYVLGEPRWNPANGGLGRVYVHDGATGAALWTKAGSTFGQQFGWTVARVGDQNGNGKADFLAHSHADGCWPSWNCGIGIWVLDGASGATVRVHGDTPPTLTGLALGNGLADFGDLDGDGVSDYAAGGPQAEFSGFGVGAEETRVWSGASGALLGNLLPPVYDMGFGFSVAHVDGNGDGLADIVIGDPLDDVAGHDAGRVHVYSFVRAPTTYCAAKVNSVGCTPFVQGVGTPSVSSGQPFRIKAFQVLNKKFGLLFYAFTPQSVPFQGGRLCMKLPITRCGVLNSGGNPPPNDCSGAYAYDFNDRIRNGVDPALVAGEEVFAQYWSRDLGDPFATGLTDALALFIEP
ncbi:MAG: hypothetical protein K8S98_18780 [Planctomycetes bacterium]|nr:hypothetical protein [Planctomycetota bacterium]